LFAEQHFAGYEIT